MFIFLQLERSLIENPEEPNLDFIRHSDADQFEMHCFELNKLMTKYSNDPEMKLKLYKLFNVVKIQLFNQYFQN